MSDQIKIPTRTLVYRIIPLSRAFSERSLQSVPVRDPPLRMVR